MYFFFSLTILVATPHESLESVRALRAQDPDLALEMAQAAWLDEAHPQRVEMGAEVIGLLADLKRLNDIISFADDFLDVAPPASDEAAFGMIQFIQAIANQRVWDDHPNLFNQAENIARQTTSALNRSDIIGELGLIRFYQANYIAAEDLIRRSIAALAGQEPPSLVLRYQQLGVMKAQQGRYAEAFEDMLQAQHINEKLQLPVNLNLLKNIGSMLFNLGDFEQSITYTQRAIDTGLAKGSSLASLYSNLGAANMSFGDNDRAFEHFQRSLDLYAEAGIKNVSVMNNMAFLLMHGGEYQNALNLLQETLVICEQDKVYELFPIVHKNMGEAWVNLKNPELAAEHFETAYRLYGEFDLRPKRLELYPLMIENLESLGQTKRALALMREYKALNDETVSVESNERIAELVSTLELERSQRELADSERDRALKAKAIVGFERVHEIERNVRLGLIAMVLGLGAIALLLIRSVRFKGRAYRVLADKNREIESLNTELKRQSSEDTLTGLHNRRFFTDFMARETPKIERALTAGGSPNMLLILADLDHFKRINDTFGHPTGDEVIRSFSQVLRICARESDILVRWGGEEFLWVCRDANIADGAELCQRVQDRLRATQIQTSNAVLSVTCSMGFAQFPLFAGDTLDWQKSLKLADMALYEAKRAGRDCWIGHHCSEAPTESQSAVELLEQGFITQLTPTHLTAE